MEKDLKNRWFRLGFKLPVLAISALLMLGACSGVMPVPGGTKTVNQDYYKDREEMLARVYMVKPGMSKADVFEILEREEDDFQILSRNQIVLAMYGTDNINLTQDMYFLKNLYGYSMQYAKVKRNHGFNSPISMKTKENGYAYTVTLIFEGDKLHENPIISGGDSYGSDSNTIFDYLTPGNAMSAVF